MQTLYNVFSIDYEYCKIIESLQFFSANLLVLINCQF